jgi:tRNA dimethylallyltransferase
LISIVGPTGVGKSNLAIRIALRFNGEIVNGDSRQIYRYMDIGTAKPSEAELNLVPHHLFNIVNPDDEYHLAQYQLDADSKIKSILQRPRLPVLVGGSGQYIMGLLEGWQVPRVSPDIELRNRLARQASDDSEALYRQLQDLDPAAAAKIDKRNIRRVVRALEVCLQSGGQFSQMRTKKPPEYDVLWIGLTMSRQSLYQRTDTRVEEMFKRGLLRETEKLLEMGYSEELPSMSSIGYRQAIQLLRQEFNEQEAILKVQTETHRYIRHQYAWFKLKDPRIKWFDNGKENWTEIENLVSDFLKVQ